MLDVAPVGVRERDAEDLVVLGVLVAHAEQRHRLDLDAAAGERRLGDDDHHVERVAVGGQRVPEEAVVGRVAERGEQQPVELDRPELLVPLVLVRGALRDLDDRDERLVGRRAWAACGRVPVSGPGRGRGADGRRTSLSEHSRPARRPSRQSLLDVRSGSRAARPVSGRLGGAGHDEGAGRRPPVGGRWPRRSAPAAGARRAARVAAGSRAPSSSPRAGATCSPPTAHRPSPSPRTRSNRRRATSPTPPGPSTATARGAAVRPRLAADVSTAENADAPVRLLAARAEGRAARHPGAQPPAGLGAARELASTRAGGRGGAAPAEQLEQPGLVDHRDAEPLGLLELGARRRARHDVARSSSTPTTVTLPPAARMRSVACSRVRSGSVPVSTNVWSRSGPSPGGGPSSSSARPSAAGPRPARASAGRRAGVDERGDLRADARRLGDLLGRRRQQRVDRCGTAGRGCGR